MAKLVLAIGDDHLARVYQIQLALDGHRVMMAGDTAEALAICRSDDPDLVLSDHELGQAEPNQPVFRVRPGTTAPQVSQAVRRLLAAG